MGCLLYRARVSAGARRTAETATFPIAGYDEMNVDEISERVDALTDEQVRRLRDYEKANQNRKTLIERFESGLRASSAAGLTHREVDNHLPRSEPAKTTARSRSICTANTSGASAPLPRATIATESIPPGVVAR
jgi:hypothetical protein